MQDLPDLGNIQQAIWAARRMAQRAYNTARSADDYDEARDLERVASAAESDMRKLSELYPDIRSMKRERDRAYDAYVLNRREPDKCTCHLSPPCSYCIEASKEEEE
jgi:hypothetical protein